MPKMVPKKVQFLGKNGFKIDIKRIAFFGDRFWHEKLVNFILR